MNLKKLKALAANATPGPWKLVFKTTDPLGQPIYHTDKIVCPPTKGPAYLSTIVECQWGAATERGEADYSYIAALSPERVLALLDVAEAAQALVKDHQYKTPAGYMNCRYCDNNMDHEGTYQNMHADNCMVRVAAAALDRLEKMEV